LQRVGLNGKGNRLPGEASGGEKERCAIARAIVNAPPVLLADEPTGNLDTRTTDVVMDLFKGLNAEGMTIVMVTHSNRCAAHVDRILSMADGRLAKTDHVTELRKVCGGHGERSSTAHAAANRLDQGRVAYSA
jgi:putative ABC transport system ATP-binding protein